MIRLSDIVGGTASINDVVQKLAARVNHILSVSALFFVGNTCPQGRNCRLPFHKAGQALP